MNQQRIRCYFVDKETTAGISKREGGKRRAQAATEFLSIYGFALLLVTVAAVLLLALLAVPQSTTSNQCSFSGYITCKTLVLSSNSQATAATLLLSNAQEYAILSPSVTVNVTGVGSLTGSCNPSGVILPGGIFECTVTTSKSMTLNQLASGQVSVSATICAQAQGQGCVGPGAVPQVYGGTFTAHVQPQTSAPQCSISITAKNMTQLTSGKDLITANVRFLNYPIAGASINFTSNTPTVSLSPEYSNSDSNGNALTYASSNQLTSANILAQFGTCTASVNGITFLPNLVVSVAFTPVCGTTGSTATTNDGSTSELYLPGQTVQVTETPNSISGATVGSPAWTCSGSGCPSSTSSSNPWTFTVSGTAYITANILPPACSGATVTYSSSGTYTASVPPSCGHATVQLWGGGGGTGTSHESGGGGGYISGTAPVVPCNTLYFYVGGGGGDEVGGSPGNGASGGGPEADGGGGGFSAVSNSANVFAGSIIVAGGGGGGASIGPPAEGYGGQFYGGNGGPGGGTSGTQGTSGSCSGGSCAAGGGGGTQSSGGSGGAGAGQGSNSPDGSGTSGSQFNGGNGAGGEGLGGGCGGNEEFDAGGGGGGYYGGGGGGAGQVWSGGGCSSYQIEAPAGGGGGSSWASSSVTNAVDTGGSSYNSGNTAISAGQGGTSGNAGQNGEVIITWST